MTEYRIPADHPDCPRHPRQPDGHCIACAADFDRAASIRHAGSRAAAATVLDSMTGTQITALADELGFTATPGLSTEELRNRALNVTWPPADEPTPPCATRARLIAARAAAYTLAVLLVLLAIASFAVGNYTEWALLGFAGLTVARLAIRLERRPRHAPSARPAQAAAESRPRRARHTHHQSEENAMGALPEWVSQELDNRAAEAAAAETAATSNDTSWTANCPFGNSSKW